MQINNYPSAGAKIDSERMIIQGGGPVPTAMVALSRLGMKPALMAAVGDDVLGRFVIEELKKEKVDTSCMIVKTKPTAIASGWIENGSGRRTIVLNKSLAVAPSDIKPDRLPDARAVHLDGRDLTACMKLARWARRRNIPVIFDIGSVRNDISEILPLVDHLVCADAFALPYTGSRKVARAIEQLKTVCHGTIVVTSGTKGAVGIENDSAVARQKAFKVKAVDTTGAGDVYHGAYIFGFLKGWDLKKRMEFSSAAAAIKCTAPGGRTGAPTYRQVLAFLKKGAAVYA